ncbi:MAG: ABC transporter permease, partial [Pseudomonadota bacterium]
MLDNYLRVAWRHIAGNPLFSTINVIGLAIGLASCIVITLFVRYELSYDKHWVDADRTHRVVRDFYGNNLRLAAVAPPIGPLLQQDFPEVEDQVRMLVPGQITLVVDGEPRVEDHMVVADTHAIDFLGLEVLEGDRASALASPTSLVMTRRGAERYFGSESAVGKTLQLMGRLELTVTAVIEDLPTNTHMAFEMLASITAVPLLLGEDQLENWGSNNYYTYLRLQPGTSPEALEERFPGFLIKHLGENANDGTGLELQAIGDIHLHSNRDAEWRANGSINNVYTFSAVALFVLLIACINFMNLTTALSTQRAKEVGVRKVIGASRGQLVAQFLGESILLTALAMLLAVALVELTLPLFASFVERPLEIDLLSPNALLALVGGTLLVGVFAGSYPALFLSQFRPAQVLKGRDASTGSNLLRRVLVVFQFATSIALLIATGVVMLQMQYARNLDLGYDKSRNLTSGLPFFAPLWELYEPMKQALEAHPDIESAVYSSRVPGMQNLDGGGYVGPDVQFTRE